MAQLNKGSLLLRCAAHALQVGLERNSRGWRSRRTWLWLV
jgi:hypothetical protein